MKKTKSYHKNYKRYQKPRYNRYSSKGDIIKLITSNKFLLAVLCILFILAVVVSNYSAAVSMYFDLPIFIVATILIAKGTWFLMKRINKINLEPDLNCWGLRIAGGISVLVGLFVLLLSGFMFTGILYEFGTDASIPLFLFTIPFIGLSIIVIGVFSEFRSLRRYGYFVYMR